MDVFFYEAFEEEAVLLAEMIGKEFTFACSPKTIQEEGHQQPPAKLASIRTQSRIPAQWAGAVGGILSRSTGYDHLVAYRSAVVHAPPLGFLEEYATRAVAEHAIMLSMALLRKLPQQLRQFEVFNRDRLTGSQCEGTNLLVVGVGRIGSEIVKIANALGFTVKGVDIVPDKKDVDYVSKEIGIGWADLIVCSMNLTKENGGYFSYKLLRQAKKGCIFVNIARGEHSPLADLERLLDDGHLGGLGLDVFQDEGALAVSLGTPGDILSPQTAIVKRILSHPNVLLTPHNAFNSTEAIRRKSAMTVEQIHYFLKHGDFKWKI